MDKLAKVTSETHTVVLYHRGCNDGIAAAWSAWRKFGNQAVYIPYQYGEAIPLECDERHVIMLDLSLKEDQLTEMAMRAKSLLIVDHHKSAKDLCFRLPAVKTYGDYMKYRCRAEGDGCILFDENWSGAVLSWALFNNVSAIVPEEIPLPLRLIHDYDLWKHEMADTKPINAWLINGGLTIERVDELMVNGPTAEMLAVGHALMRYDDKIIRSVLREYVESFTTEEGVTYAMVNAPHHLRNEIGDRLKDKYDFVVLYTRRKERTVYSLRSKKDGGYDTTIISGKLGGGGHAPASAFSLAHGSNPGSTIFSPFNKPTLLQRLSMAWGVLRGVTA